MKLEDLALNYLNGRTPHERKLGRFNSSELWGIVNGKIKPQDFFKPKEYDIEACRNIIEGEEKEETLKKIFDGAGLKYEYQTKKVIKVNDMEIVVVADFNFPDKIIECKSPKEMGDGIKPWNRCQLACQYMAFEKPVYVLYLKDHLDYRIFKYFHDTKFWNDMIIDLEKFYIRLKKCQKQS